MAAIYNFFFGPENRFILINNIEDDWVDVSPVSQTSQAIVPYIFEKSAHKPAYTVEEPDDAETPLLPLNNVRPLSGELIVEIEEQTLQNGPIVEDAESGIVLAAPQRQGIPAPILTVAIAAGAAAQTAGVGALALETAVGVYCMNAIVNPASWTATQLLQIHMARATASAIISTPILGVSLPVIANVGVALLAAAGVAHLGIFLYNRVTSQSIRIEHSGATSIVASRFLGIEGTKQ